MKKLEPEQKREGDDAEHVILHRRADNIRRNHAPNYIEYCIECIFPR